MAFNSSSYFVGVGTAFAAIAIGFAGGAMIPTDAVQPPNRLEQVAAGKTPPPGSGAAPSIASNATAPPAQEPPAQTVIAAPPPPPVTVAAAPSAAVVDPQPVQQPQPAPAPVAKSPAPAPVVKNEDAAPLKNERASARPVEVNKEPSHKKIEERKFSEDRKLPERKRRPDLQELDEVTNVVRRLPRDGAIDEVVERDEAPRLIDSPRPRIGLFGN
jgi:hypothetical protein